MRTVAIVQARLGSSRLPGKVLLPLDGSRTLLECVLGCVEPVAGVLADCVVATTDRYEDDALVDYCRGLQISVFRGSSENVLGRFVEAAKCFRADAVLRICADNPLLDSELVVRLVEFAHHRQPDYAGYKTVAGVPAICTGAGLFAEWVSTAALCRLADSHPPPQIAEHVTLGIYSHPQYDRAWLSVPDWAEVPWLRLTCDTAEDLDRLRRIFSSGPVAGPRGELVAWLAAQPALVQAMAESNQAHGKPDVHIVDPLTTERNSV